RYVHAGQAFDSLSGGPMCEFNGAFSFLLKCDTEEEIDYCGGKLTDGGEEQPCGWLKDKYGLSWQIIPPILDRLLTDPDKEKAGRVMQAMMKMKKIDIRALEDAYASPAHA